MSVEELIRERNLIEQLALSWADRWIAANSQFTAEEALAVVRPISFHRVEVEAAKAEASRGTQCP